MTFTLPPDTRAIGTGNPPEDMNGVVDALLATGVAYNVQSTAFSGGADPAGSAASDGAFSAAITAAVSDGRALIVPGGTYKFTSGNPIDAKFAGLQIIGPDGSANTQLVQHASNVPILQVAGQGQRIRGLTLEYTSQQGSGATSANNMQFGDDSVGSCFESSFEDIYCQLGYTPMVVNPALVTSAGLFSCDFRNIHILGYYQHAIGLSGNAGGGSANCTGCTFTNTYIHNNYTGSPAGANSYPVYLEAWDEIVFNQLNIEHGESFILDLIGLSAVGSAMINDLHIESMQLSGSSGNAAYINLDGRSGVIVNGLTGRFCTLTGTTDNAVVRFSGSGPGSAIINGFNEASDVTVGGAGVHPYADFAGVADCTFQVNGITASQVTGTAINAGAGCFAKVATADANWASGLIKPAAALAETYPRQLATTGSTTGSPGTVYARIIGLRAGTLVSDITFFTASNVKTGGTHGWYVLLDSSATVLAVTADQTDPGTVWGTGATKYTLAVTTPYTIPVDGYYYLGLMVAETGGSMPNFESCALPPSVINSLPPILCGISSGSQSTPPSVGASLSGVSNNTGFNYYGYVS